MQLTGWDAELCVAALVQVGFPGHAQQLQPPQVLGKRGEQKKASQNIYLYIYMLAQPKDPYFRGSDIYMSMYVCMDGLMAVYIYVCVCAFTLS